MQIHKLGLLVLVFFMLAFMTGSVQAASYVGTPSPALSPVFGTLVNFDDQPAGTVVGASDYQAWGVSVSYTHLRAHET